MSEGFFVGPVITITSVAELPYDARFEQPSSYRTLKIESLKMTPFGIPMPQKNSRASERTKEWQQKNHEQYLAYLKEYRKKNKVKLRLARRAVALANPDRELGWKLKKYGITVEDYRSMLASQSGVCAICGGPPTGNHSQNRPYHVDHDHLTGKVRGLLCTNCNILIGQAKESPERLEKAIAYLRNAK